ncbi:hypothetical protein ABPG74_006488 [Tetrahymena malaccensis]
MCRLSLLNTSYIFYVLSFLFSYVQSQGQFSISYCQSLGLQNCLMCSPSTQQGQNTCYQCTDNYALNVSQTQCIVNLGYCAQLDQNNDCVLCKCSYVLFEYIQINSNQQEQVVMKKCVSVTTPGVTHGCAVYRVQDQQMNCIQANSNYVLKKSAQPYTIVPHNGSFCAEIASDGVTCTKCQPGYQNIKGQNTCFKGTSPIFNSQMAYYDTASSTIKPLDPTWYADPNGVIPPIANCQFYSPITKNGPGTCESCFNGYIPSKDKSQCLQYSDSLCAYAQIDASNKITCSVCYSPQLYYVDGTTGNCVVRQNFKSLNCAVLDPNNDGCLICISSYQLLDGICFQPNDQKLQENQKKACLYQIDSTACQICNNNYILALNYNQCVNQISNCVLATDEYNCSLCMNLYHLIQDSNGFQKCIINTTASNCIYSDGQTDSCLQCANLYYLQTDQGSQQCTILQNSNNCTFSDGKNKDCIIQNPANTCASSPKPDNTCNVGYFFYKNCCYSIIIANCQIQQDFKCTLCNINYYLNSDQTGCIPVNLFMNCVQQNGQKNMCSQCNPVVDPSQNCITSQNGCNLCYLATCQTIQNGSCKTCKSGYYLENQVCKQIQNCSKTDGQTKTCTQCNNLYFPQNQTCKQITNFANCNQSNQTDNCTKCNNLYYIQSNVCTQINISNCGKSDGVNLACIECNPGYFLVNNACQQLLTNCLIYKSSSECSQCQNMYYLTSNTCTKIQNVPLNCSQTGGIYPYPFCKQCMNLYFLYNNTCKPVNLNQCSASDGFQQSCLKCGQSFYEKQIIPQSNQQSQFPNPYITCLTKSQIKNYIQGCKRYVDTQIAESCILCEDAYFITINSNNIQICQLRAFIQSQNCNVFSNSLDSNQSSNNKDVCDQCKNGFIPQGASCQAIEVNKIVPNCAVYQTNTNQCQQCIQDNSGVQKYYLNANQCQDISSLNCKTYQNQTCQECAINYQLMQNGQCVQIPIINCLKFVQGSQVQCTICRNQYYLSGNKLSCLPHDVLSNPNCAEFSQTVQNLCLQCQNLFYLNSNGICVGVTIPNCQNNTSNMNTCDVCINNYVLTGSKSNCIQDTTNSFCLQIKQENLNSPSCIKCQLGYSLQPNQFQCLNNINMFMNCVQVDSNLACIKCEDGYFLNSLSQCLSFYSVCSIVGCKQYSSISYFDSYYCENCDIQQQYYSRGGGNCQYNPNPNVPRDKGDGTFLGDGEIYKIPSQVSDQKSQQSIIFINLFLIIVFNFF